MSLGFDSQQDPKPWPCLEQLAPLFPLLLSIWSLLSFCFGHFCTSHSSPSPVPCPPGTLLRGHVAGRGGLAAARPRRKPAPLSHARVLLAAATMLNCICASGKKKKNPMLSLEPALKRITHQYPATLLTPTLHHHCSLQGALLTLMMITGRVSKRCIIKSSKKKKNPVAIT